jgi:hypothetical protein
VQGVVCGWWLVGGLRRTVVVAKGAGWCQGPAVLGVGVVGRRWGGGDYKSLVVEGRAGR